MAGIGDVGAVNAYVQRPENQKIIQDMKAQGYQFRGANYVQDSELVGTTYPLERKDRPDDVHHIHSETTVLNGKLASDKIYDMLFEVAGGKP